eukprot:Plantae.Rhodophyta-Purpureofilum_apyrenoidigerum.ctg13263.p1 GENE.Plantae.Rhodophyta-Purpureofilum_apyrenoidigerum.ctg13263~~Plantae.Rhodophyta-Purpureofilum_apyrenoidigerum.ctg13263.p1  ORF type:complete len:208 (-),score=40.90 Plantae.Rhodophyta-Purpureofilum_apyrenoidigerum.ctg13263:118-741(-)
MATVLGRQDAGTMVLTRVWQNYLLRLDTNPVMTKAISAGVLSIASSLVGAINQKQMRSPRKLINEFCIGLIIRGPVVHYFHTLLDKVIFRNVNQKSKLVVLAKVVLDQVVFAPLFISLYFYVSGLLDDKKFSEITKKIKKELFTVMKGNWSVWVPANIIGYAVIPLNLRVLWGNVINIFWTAYLISTVQGKKSKTKNAVENSETSSS